MSDFDALPQRLQSKIDKAFNKAAKILPDPVLSGLVPPAAKRRKLSHESEGGEQTNYHDEEPGGFLLEVDNDMGGGFIPEEEEIASPSEFVPSGDGETKAEDDSSKSIPLSSIPAALQLLDLPPDDPDVLSIFKNAASGWGELDVGEQGVGRNDWREVTAVLLAARVERGNETDEEEVGGFLPDEDEQGEASDYSDARDDEYQEEEDEDEYEELNHDSDQDYGASTSRAAPPSAIKGPKSRSTRKTRRTRKNSVSSASSEDAPRRITPRQKAEARKAFALFFPDIDDPSELSEKRIMFKDITRVAALLNEKLKTEEIMEMLEAFSTSADKSIGITDFENLVLTARLV